MHGDAVLRPGDAVPADVDDRTLADWQRLGLVGKSYDGPARARTVAPTQTKPAAPARRAAAKPKEAAQPDATENKAPSSDAASGSDAKPSENAEQQASAATDAVADAAPTDTSAAG